MITKEANFQRKSVRVAIPLLVEIAGQTYSVRNWSVSGIGVPGLPAVPAEGELIPARLSFPMVEATLMIQVDLVFRKCHNDVCGFDFHELSPRNRRVLRHYIELSVEGKLDDADNIVAIATTPAAQSPVEWPLNMALPAEQAHQAELAHFKSRSWGAILAGLVVLGVVSAVLFYNFAWKVEGTGFVSGSIDRITANHDGRIGKMLARPNTFVDTGAPLFTVENPTLKTEIESMERHVAQLTREQDGSASARLAAQAGLLGTLRREASVREAEVNNARQLLERGVISQRDYMQVANNYSDVRTSYLREVAEGANRTSALAATDQLGKLKMELAARKQLLASEEASQTVTAPRKGKVFQVDKAAGEYVGSRDPVVLLESDVTPSVMLRLPNDDALKLRIGMPATVYVPFEDRKYPASISAIGLAAASANTQATMEGGLNETLVKLDFEDQRVRLPANARVTVWVKTLSLPGRS